MTSSGPYTQIYDMKHMYNFTDLRKKKTKCLSNKNTLMGIIDNNPDFSIFSKIVEKARYVGKLQDIQADFTVFVPSDNELLKKYSQQFIDSIDDGFASQILAFSIMNRKIDKSLIQSSPYSIFPTTDRSNSMYVNTSMGVTSITNNTNVIHWNNPADNGIIHVIDNLLIPKKKFNSYPN
jgi:uncharacterized surface protein with fasciclin (FAS1) repeats